MQPVSSDRPHQIVYPTEDMPYDTENNRPQHAVVERLRTLRDLEKEAIEQALDRVGNNRRKAADILGISARTLYRKLKEYGLE